MRVLARADQRSAALDAYETCRRVLAAELGLAPAVETATLAEQIRALASVEAHATQATLPPVLTRFFGRQPESARLVDLLSRRTVRLVTLAGPGGVGKTRLAIEVAHRMAGVFAHDICLVELAGVADGRLVDDAVAAALRLPTNTGRSSTGAIVVAVARICQQLDGIPLAIEIAAAQARALPVEAIADRLDQRFAWQNRRAGETRPRQHTLQTLIDWSYGLLSHHARPMLRRLAVFAGGWTLEAAEAVSAPGEPLFQQLGEQRGEIDARLMYCELAALAGEYVNLQAQAEEALRMAEHSAYMAGIAKAKLVLGTIAYYTGENEAAMQYLLPSIALWRELESPFDLATALNRLAGALSAIKEYAASQQAYEECRDIYQSLGYRRGVATAIQNLGGIALDLGDYARARALFCDGLRIRHDLGLPRGYAYSFEFIADIDVIEERYERAVQLLAAAETLRARIGAPPEPVNQNENVNALKRLRAQLGDVAYELAWSKGGHLTTEQAIALALS